jgi:hypothetical protein
MERVAGFGGARRAPGPAGSGTTATDRALALRRPDIRSRTTPLSDAAKAACTDLLRMHDGRSDMPANDIVTLEISDTDTAYTGRSDADHVPASLGREGRSLTFFVAGALAAGSNRVAIPTTELQGGRKQAAKIIVFSAARPGAGQIDLPLGLVPTIVPGARRLTIAFSGDDAG